MLCWPTPEPVMALAAWPVAHRLPPFHYIGEAMSSFDEFFTRPPPTRVLLQKTKSRTFVRWKLLIFQCSIFRFSLKNEFLQQNPQKSSFTPMPERRANVELSVPLVPHLHLPTSGACS